MKIDMRSVHTKRIDAYALRLMPLLAFNKLEKSINLQTVKQATALADWQLEIRKWCDPIDADNKYAKMEQSIRKQLSKRGDMTETQLKQYANANKQGLALDPIPTDLPPMEALARTALADPMVGSARDRADRIGRDIEAFGAEALLISRIPGASHCALEGSVIADIIRENRDIPISEIEVPPVSDPFEATVRTRIEGLIETVKQRRAQ